MDELPVVAVFKYWPEHGFARTAKPRDSDAANSGLRLVVGLRCVTLKLSRFYENCTNGMAGAVCVAKVKMLQRNAKTVQ